MEMWHNLWHIFLFVPQSVAQMQSLMRKKAAKLKNHEHMYQSVGPTPDLAPNPSNRWRLSETLKVGEFLTLFKNVDDDVTLI